MSYKSTILFIVLLFVSILSFAQDEANLTDLATYLTEQNIAVQATDYGLYYKIEAIGTGRKPKVGDYISVQFQAQLLDGTVFEESAPTDPFVFQVGYRQVIRGWDLGIREFPLGSKGTIYIPPNLGYGKRGAGQEVPPNAPLKLDIAVLKILTQAEYDNYMDELEAKEQAAYEAEIRAQFVEDKKLIQNYALSNKLRTKRTPEGVSYVITRKGKGSPAQIGDELEVSYQGYLLDGKSFDSTKHKGNFKFELGRRKVIQGWEKSLIHFSEGSEGIILVPSKLAYGPSAIYEENIAIPANSVLIFNIKVEKIERAEVN
ncbi:MAG: FKBP-type peptidyl-prolyl cis-trans isomerase [Bacteroidota bacterium]